MKLYIKLVFCLVVISLSSCDGEFVEADVAINLVYPLADETCEDATLTQNSVEVPFRWSVQGDFNDFVLFVNGEEQSEQITFDEENKQYQAIVSLNYRNEYTWSIVGKRTVDFKSDERTFSTPATFENNNFAPYPVEFEKPITSPGQVIINWSAEDPDGAAATEELRFDVYLDESNPPTTLRDPADLQTPTITINNLERKKYFVMIIAKDKDGNSSSNIISFDGE